MGGGARPLHVTPLPEVELAWRLDALLGEGPVWLPNEQALRFVDIRRGRLHRFDPATRAGETHDVGGAPGFIAPCAGGGFLVGSRQSIHRSDGAALGPVVATLPERPGNRINDAGAAPDGRLWFGTMDDAERERTGSIWYLDRGRPVRAGGEAVVTNGPAVDRAGRWLYHVDSPARTIWRVPLDGAPALAGAERFVTIDPADGHPDGVVVDAEDCLWVALWDGWGVRRYAPDGALLMHVPLPCQRVTKLALGGPDLRIAFVTTARVGLREDALALQPLAGGLFRFAAPAPGFATPAVRLD